MIDLFQCHQPVDRTATAERDAECVARAKRDRHAFGALYDRYLDPVYRYCHVRLGSREAAEDATSLVFQKALAGLTSCRDDSFRSWLFAIAHNVVIDAHRASVSRPMATLDAARETPDPRPSPDDLAERNDEGRRVRESLARLTPEQRAVVELRLAGLSGPEIAAALGRSHAAIRIAQFRAYGRLRALLGAESSEEIDHVATA